MSHKTEYMEVGHSHSPWLWISGSIQNTNFRRAHGDVRLSEISKSCCWEMEMSVFTLYWENLGLNELSLRIRVSRDCNKDREQSRNSFPLKKHLEAWLEEYQETNCRECWQKGSKWDYHLYWSCQRSQERMKINSMSLSLEMTKLWVILRSAI